MSTSSSGKGRGIAKARDPGDDNQQMPSPSHEQQVFKVNEFLTHVVQEMYPVLSRFEVKYDEIEDMIFEKLLDWLENPREDASYGNSELEVHDKLWSVMKTDKDGAPKEHSFVDWCRKIALHRKEFIATKNAATEHADIAANNAATEHAGPFRTLVKDIWANELTPSQRKKSKYKLYECSSISTGLRSVVNAILRKNLGDSRVAAYILEHGVPTLLDPPWIRRTLPRTEMDSMLEKFLEWHASLLKWLGNRQNDPNTIVARKLSDLKEKKWQAERRRKKSDIEQQLRQGACLANLRDSHAKRFHDMSATEQRVLEDYETGKLRKRLDAVRIRKPNQQAPKGPA